jgi:hypothetical protein
MNDELRQDVLRLKDELSKRAFDGNQEVKNSDLAEVVWKLNSCLGQGYPRKK